MLDSLLVVRLALLLSAGGTAFLAWMAWQRRKLAPAAVPFSLLCVAIFIYAFGHALELSQADRIGVRFWLHVQYLGVPWIPALWMMVTLAFTGRPWATRGRLGLLLVIPVITFLAHHTDPWHHTYYRAFEVYGHPGDFSLLIDRGPFHLLNTVFVQASFAMGVMLLAGQVARLRPGYHRRQVLAVLAGSSIPWFGFMAHYLGWSPHNLDVTPLALALAGLLFGYGILHLQIFDLLPLAREEVFMGMRDAAVVADGHGLVVDYNPAALRVFPELVRGAPVRIVFAAWPDLARALLGDTPLKRLTLPTEEGLRRYQVNLFKVSGPGGETGWAAVLADQTEVHRAMDELRQLATTDALTGASNRRHFQEHLELAFQRSARYITPLAVITMDLDHFKRVNDTRGHAAGDAVLQVAVARTYTCLRDMDTLGRLGGEEFAVVLEGTDLTGAVRVAERIREQLARVPVEWRGEPIPLTASLGVAVHPGGPGGDPLELLRRSDMAVYRAKAEGRNRVCS